MNIKNIMMASACAAAICGMMTETAFALGQGDLLVRIGLSNVSPDDSSGGFSGSPTIGVAVAADSKPSITLAYMLKDNIGIELLGAVPFEHDLTATGSLTTKVATTKQLPPTLSVLYYFDTKSHLRPYASVGVNYTTFFDVNTTGALAGTTLSLDDSWGLAAQVGVDYDISADWYLNASVRYINIETVARSSALGTVDVEINPWVFTLSAGTSF